MSKARKLVFGPKGSEFFRKIMRGWQLAEHQEAVLIEACRVLDRVEQARLELDEAGSLTIEDGRGTVRPHPCVLIERDGRALFGRLVRELALDDGAPDSRPPALRGRYQSRA